MSPEVYLNQPYNNKVDIFSFGVVLYEVCERYVRSRGGCRFMSVYAFAALRLHRTPYNIVELSLGLARGQSMHAMQSKACIHIWSVLRSGLY